MMGFDNILTTPELIPEGEPCAGMKTCIGLDNLKESLKNLLGKCRDKRVKKVEDNGEKIKNVSGELKKPKGDANGDKVKDKMKKPPGDKEMKNMEKMSSLCGEDDAN